jgi:hypothetical protein
MASESEVKKYIACWMQLGKKVWTKAGQSFCLVHQVLERDRYSPEFDACWAQILDLDSGDCYLEGTSVTVQNLLSPAWEILDCPRCDMPVSMSIVELPSVNCPCNDLPNWPNTELPLPRAPINSQERLSMLQKHLGN